jgi:hypothetical protein
MKKKKTLTDWVTTSAICQRLGITDSQLYALRDDGLFKQKTHWRDVSRPTAMRPTYRWHLENCERALDER